MCDIFFYRSRKQLAGPFAPGFRVTCRCFAVSHDAKFIYSAGHWDNSLRVYSISKNKTVAHITRHTGMSKEKSAIKIKSTYMSTTIYYL